MSNQGIDWSRHPETTSIGADMPGLPRGSVLYLHKSECTPTKIVYKSFPERRDVQAKPDDDSAVS